MTKGKLLTTVAAAAAAAGWLAGPASASELELAPAQWSWAGHYFGDHAGWAWGDVDVSEKAVYNGSPTWGYDVDGFSGGAQVGYNWQWGSLVFGPIIELGYRGLDGSATDPASPGLDTTSSLDSSFFVGTSSRVGFALNNFLFYARGGVLYADMDLRVVDTCTTGACGGGVVDASNSGFELAWTVGGGVEYGFVGWSGHRWSLKGEYIYADFGSIDAKGTAGGALAGTKTRWSHDVQAHIVNAGVNFFF